MGLFHLGIAESKRSGHGPKKTHEFKCAPDRHPNNAQKDIGTGYQNHCSHKRTCNQHKRPVQNPANFLQNFHITDIVDWVIS
jgi:hypothetical protein